METTTTQNADPDELQKFADLASRWWEPEGEFRPLHQINPLRVNFIDERTPVAGKKILDIGCGGGILSEALTKKGAEVTAIDLSEAPLSVAKLHAAQSGLAIDYQLISAEDMAEKTAGQWDIVTCLEMLEHVPDPSSIVNACAQLVKPGGSVYFSTLNRNPKSFLMAIVGAEYILNLLPKGTHSYDKFIKPSELAQWAETSGLNLKAMTGMHYNPLTRKYRLGPGVDVNYLMYTEKPQNI